MAATFMSRDTVGCAAIVAATAAVAIAATISVALPRAAQAQGSFYQASAGEIAGRPGTLIRQEPLFGAPAGATAHRVLYRSTDPQGRPIAVSGVVIVPPGPVPPGGRPIIAWAHPTSGIVPRCAPSLAIFLFQQIQGSRELVEQGYVIAATDYPGLGTPGPHPYLVGDSEARAVIDSVRVARSLPGVGGGNRYAVWGHSQGGQAALFTGLISQRYAPELRLVGVAAAAPATYLGRLMDDDMNTSGGKNLTAMTLWSWARVFGAPIDSVVTPEALPVVDQLAQECIEGPFDIFVRAHTSKPLMTSFLSVQNLSQREPWRSLLARNTPGPMPPSIPAFIAQGTTDALVRPEVTRSYVQALCKNGSRVRVVMMPDVGHGAAAMRSANAAVGWMADRFAGSPPPDDCGSV
jgi:acetyl esterase/lipase